MKQLSTLIMMVAMLTVLVGLSLASAQPSTQPSDLDRPGDPQVIGSDYPMEIVLCWVGGQREQYDETVEELRRLGYPISDRTCEQLGYTNTPAEKLRDSWFVPMVGRVIDRATEREPDFVYADWEPPNYNGVSGMIDIETFATNAYLVDRSRETGAQVSLWGFPAITSRLPSSSVSGIATFKLIDRIAPLDWICVNTYIRNHCGVEQEEPLRRGIPEHEFANRLTHAISISRLLADGRPIMAAWQGQLRNSYTEELTPLDVRVWWETIASNGVTQVLWWFETGPDGSQLDQRMQEARWQSPIVVGALNKAVIE